MTRLNDYVNQLREQYDDNEIVAGLGNGDIDLPECYSMSESSDSVKLWDSEEGGSAQMGFYTITASEVAA